MSSAPNALSFCTLHNMLSTFLGHLFFLLTRLSSVGVHPNRNMRSSTASSSRTGQETRPCAYRRSSRWRRLSPSRGATSSRSSGSAWGTSSWGWRPGARPRSFLSGTAARTRLEFRLELRRRCGCFCSSCGDGGGSGGVSCSCFWVKAWFFSRNRFLTY